LTSLDGRSPSIQAALLRRQGVTRLVWLVSYRADQIEAVLGDGRRWGMPIRVPSRWTGLARPQVAHSNALCRGWVRRFFVMYGDSYLACEFRDGRSRFSRERPTRAS